MDITEPDPRDDDERAADALHESIFTGSLPEIQVALANPALRNPLAADPLKTAVDAGSLEVLVYFLQAGFTMTAEGVSSEIDVSALHAAVEVGRLDMLELLLKQPDAPAFLNAFHGLGLGWNPLIEAAKSGKVEIVKCLLAAGSDVNAHDESNIGETALMYAVMERHAEVVRVLLAAGANPDIPGFMWNSARDRAAQSTSAIRAMIKKVPFRPTDHPRYTRSPKSET